MRKSRHTPGGVSVTVKGRNVTVTPALHDQVVHKMIKMDRYLDRLQTIEIELCAEKTRGAALHNHVEATTYIAGRTIRVRATDGDMYAAIDEAVDKLYRQLNRQKERMKAHHNGRLMDTVPDDEETALPAESDGADARERSVRVERLDVKPQFEDEAIEHMETLGRSFYVFLNARNERINVVYRRPDGDYGLIEPTIG